MDPRTGRNVNALVADKSYFTLVKKSRARAEIEHESDGLNINAFVEQRRKKKRFDTSNPVYFPFFPTWRKEEKNK